MRSARKPTLARSDGGAPISKPETALPLCPADRCETLEVIAGVLRRGELDALSEELAAWMMGVEIVERLEPAGFAVARSTTASAPDATP